MKRKLKWILTNLPMMAILYPALVLKSDWAKNITIFCVWFNFAISTFALVMASFNKEFHAKIHKKGRAVNKYVDITYDIIYIVALVAAGWMWVAAAYLSATFFQYAIYETKPKKIKNL